MKFTTYVTDTATGSIVDTIPVAKFDFARKLSSGGTSSVDIPLITDFSKWQWRDLTDHWRRSIFLEADGVILGGGAVKSRRRGSGSHVLTVDLVDAWGVLADRLAVDKTAPNVEKWSVKYAAMSLRTLAKRAVQRGTTGVTSPASALPITLEADVAGTLTQEYFGYHFETVVDVLDDLMAEGLDVEFQPVRSGNFIRWTMKTAFTPTIREWNLSMIGPGASAWSCVEDGSTMANNVVVIGEGSEEDMIVRSNRSLTSPFPLRERVESRKTLTTGDAASRAATQLMTDSATPVAEWTLTLPVGGADGMPKLTDIRLGDTARLYLRGDPFFEDGWHERRIVAVAGGVKETFELTTQALGA